MSRLVPGLQNAIQRLGTGFIACPGNHALRERLRTPQGPREFYDQLLRIVYGLVALLIAEERNLLPRAVSHQLPFGQKRTLKQSDGPAWHQLGAALESLDEPWGSSGGGIPLRSIWSSDLVPCVLFRPRAERQGGAPAELSDAVLRDVIRALQSDGGQSSGESGIDFRKVQPEELGSAYEQLLELSAQVDLSDERESERFKLVSASLHARKTSGSYYTPGTLVQHLLDVALEPLIARATQVPEHAERDLLSLKVCDPACGTGNFLIAAARRLAHRLLQLRYEEDVEPSPEVFRAALREVIANCIYGVDVNPMAADLCRLILWLESADSGGSATALDQHVKCGNALLGAPTGLVKRGASNQALPAITGDDAAFQGPEHARLVADAWCSSFVWADHIASGDLGASTVGALPRMLTERLIRDLRRDPASVSESTRAAIASLAARHRFFHWGLEFPEVFGRGRPGFDVILGNPPFLNQLETATVNSRPADALLKLRFGCATRGYTDLSATFLLAALELTSMDGRVALVQPQSLLAVKDAAPVRRALLERASLETLWVSNEHVFEGAGVFTCAPTLHIGGPRRSVLRRYAKASFGTLTPMEIDEDQLANEETWSHLAAAASGIPEFRVRRSPGLLAEIAHATADFRDQYYGLDGFVVEDAAMSDHQRSDWRNFPPIVTSGLIDLCQSHWGMRSTRILKSAWDAPRVDRGRMEQEGTLGTWIAARLAPKVIVATQTRIIEVLPDEAGILLPSLPLITLTPKDPSRLWHVAAAIASPVCSAIAMQRYGGAALSVHAIKLSAKQVLRMPLPVDQQAWDRAAVSIRAATHACDPHERAHALGAFATASIDSYLLERTDADSVLRWWTQRLDASAPARAGRQSRKPLKA